MNGKNQLFITYETSKFEKEPVVQDFMIITHQFGSICSIYLTFMKKKRNMSTCDQLDIDRLCPDISLDIAYFIMMSSYIRIKYNTHTFIYYLLFVYLFICFFICLFVCLFIISLFEKWVVRSYGLSVRYIEPQRRQGLRARLH
jgi:hypothetical protein